MITLEDARRIIAAAEKKAVEIGQPMNIAVADAGGNLVALVRMDNAWMGSIDISIKKAWTSRAFDISTKDLAEHSQSGDQFFGIHASNGGKVMIFAGGIPLKKPTARSSELSAYQAEAATKTTPLPRPGQPLTERNNRLPQRAARTAARLTTDDADKRDLILLSASSLFTQTPVPKHTSHF